MGQNINEKLGENKTENLSAGSDLDLLLLNEFQREFPLVERPFLEIAQRLGRTESEILEAYQKLFNKNKISRIGPIFAPGKAGYSTLAAMRVDPSKLEVVAELVNTFPEVNHNYEREDEINLWFVVTAPTEDSLVKSLQNISQVTGHEVYDMRLEREFRIDLAFNLRT